MHTYYTYYTVSIQHFDVQVNYYARLPGHWNIIEEQTLGVVK